MAARGDDAPRAPSPPRGWPTAGVTFVGPVLDEYPTGTCVVLVVGRRRAHDAARPRRQRPAADVGHRRAASTRMPGLGPPLGLRPPRTRARATPAGPRCPPASPAAPWCRSTPPAPRPSRPSAPRRSSTGSTAPSLVFANDDEIDALGGVKAVLDHVGRGRGEARARRRHVDRRPPDAHRRGLPGRRHRQHRCRRRLRRRLDRRHPVRGRARGRAGRGGRASAPRPSPRWAPARRSPAS